jgi:hypothetical protein
VKSQINITPGFMPSTSSHLNNNPQQIALF